MMLERTMKESNDRLEETLHPSMESLSQKVEEQIHRKPILVMVSRSYTVIVLVISLVLLLTVKGSIAVDAEKKKFISMWNLASQRYVLIAIILGSATNLSQLGLLIYFMITGRGKEMMTINKYKIFFDYYADKILSLLLAAGVGAQLASTFDITKVQTFTKVGSFFVVDKISSLLLATALVSSAISSSCSEKAVQRYRDSIEKGEEKVGAFRSWAAKIYNFYGMKFNPQ